MSLFVNERLPNLSASEVAPNLGPANTVMSGNAGVTDTVKSQWDWHRRGIQGIGGLGFALPSLPNWGEWKGIPITWWAIGIGGVIVLSSLLERKDNHG